MAEMLNSVHQRELCDPGVARPSLVRRPRAITQDLHIDLVPAVRAQVIPRLHAALKQSPSLPRARVAAGRLSGEIAGMADRLLAGDNPAIFDHVDQMRFAGCALETIYLEVLAPAACQLRDRWSDDLCGLADVTLALCALQGVLRHYANAFQAEGASRGTGLRALLVTPRPKGLDVGLPTFGLVLMSEFFRREGWDTWIERDLGSPGCRETMLDEWFDLVEILATGDDQLDAISSGIRAIRRGSPNPSLGVIVCGQIFLDRPDYVRLVGADLVAGDPLTSLSQAKTYVTRSTPRKRLS